MVPSADLSSPAKVRSRVVFPDPEEPVMATKEPGCKARSKFLINQRSSTLRPSP